MAAPTHLTFGLFPYVSTSNLFAQHKSIWKHINTTTDFRLSPVTTGQIPTFVERVQSGAYDLILVAPHLARYALKNFAYQALVMTDHQIKGAFFVARDSSVRSLADLSGKIISMPAKLTLVHQLAELELKKLGLIEGLNITIKSSKTHSNAVYEVLNGDSDAAVVGSRVLESIDPAQREHLRIIGESVPAPGFVVLVKTAMEIAEVDKLRQAFLAFSQSSLAKDYIFNGFKPVDERELETMDAYTAGFEQ